VKIKSRLMSSLSERRRPSPASCQRSCDLTAVVIRRWGDKSQDKRSIRVPLLYVTVA